MDKKQRLFKVLLNYRDERRQYKMVKRFLLKTKQARGFRPWSRIRIRRSMKCTRRRTRIKCIHRRLMIFIQRRRRRRRE
jgi:hypothetical protein